MFRIVCRVSILVLLLVYFANSPYNQRIAGDAPNLSIQNDNKKIIEAFRARISGLMVESVGTVDKILSDDLEGSPHQRFILRFSGGHTLLLAHNIAIAHRIDTIKEGDTVYFRGQYEWNAKGGVIHWTHHDPNKLKKSGWLEHSGKRYE